MDFTKSISLVNHVRNYVLLVVLLLCALCAFRTRDGLGSGESSVLKITTVVTWFSACALKTVAYLEHWKGCNNSMVTQ